MAILQTGLAMLGVKTLQSLFKRYRRPGDIVFAWFMLIASLFLLLQLTKQTTWRDGGALLTQPRFWPSVALGGMVIFAAFHLLGSACSDRIRGRREEVWLWIRSLEYAGWLGNRLIELARTAAARPGLAGLSQAGAGQASASASVLTMRSCVSSSR